MLWSDADITDTNTDNTNNTNVSITNIILWILSIASRICKRQHGFASINFVALQIGTMVYTKLQMKYYLLAFLIRFDL